MSIKVKVIGAGSIGNHLTQAARRMGWEVTVVDRDQAALDRMRTDIYPTRYGAWDETIKQFTSVSEPRGGYDIICIGTPPDVRMRLALAALAEKPTILQLEKPLCTPLLEGLDEFEALYNQQKDTVALMGYDHAIAPSVIAVFKLLEAGFIGEVQTLDVEFREHWQGIFSAHPWLKGPEDTYLGFWQKGGGASGEHSHALHLWYQLAARSGLGAWQQVSSVMELQKVNGAEYDSLAAFNLVTDSGKVGRVIQDVITSPTRKWARLQGKLGFIEWIANGNPAGDLVRHGLTGQPATEEVFAKKRPDDFYAEMLHFQDVLDGKVSGEVSPLSLTSGVAVMKVLNAVHTNRNQTVNIG